MATVQLPDSLPVQLFLLAVRPATGRLSNRMELGLILRAAALADLQLSGHLVDDGGRPQAVNLTTTGDPLLDEVLQQVAGDPGRGWGYWVRRQPRHAVQAVCGRLVAEYRIELRRYRMLWVLPARRIVLRNRFERDRVVGAVDAALGDGWPVGDRTAALVAVAAAARMRAVLPRPRRRAHRKRIAELTARAGPIPVALRKALP
jgi:Golgi phosphoprotein 3 (GPP34)